MNIKLGFVDRNDDEYEIVMIKEQESGKFANKIKNK